LGFTSCTRELQSKRKAFIQRVFCSELAYYHIFEIEQQGLALTKDSYIQLRHGTMLDFVSKAYEELKVFPHRGIVSRPVLSDTGRKLPSFSISVHNFEVSAMCFASVERLGPTFEEDRVKHCGPRDAHQYDEAAGPKTGSRSVIGLNRQEGAFAGFGEVRANFS
jgi:hypothetical protein